jgi:hypothetical protein
MWGSYGSYRTGKRQKLARMYKRFRILSDNSPFFKSLFGCNTHFVLAIRVTPELTNGQWRLFHGPSSEVGA